MTHNPIKENIIIGSIAFELSMFEDVYQMISWTDFKNVKNRSVFKAMSEVYDDKGVVNLDAVQAKCNVDVYVDYAEYGRTPDVGIDFARDIRNASVMKTSKDSLHSIVSQLQEDSDPQMLSEELGMIQEHLNFTSKRLNSKSGVEILEEGEGSQQERLWLGDAELDNIFKDSGSRRGQHVIIIADSGHGKTQVMLMLLGYYLNKGYRVLVNLLEGKRWKVANYLSKFVKPENMHLLHVTEGIFETDTLIEEARNLKKQYPDLAIMATDYIQNCEVKGLYKKFEQVEYSSDKFTKLAIELDICSISLSQMTFQGLEHRRKWGLEPRQNDTRYTQQIKQDAHLMLSVFRPSQVPELQTTDIDGSPASVSYDESIVHKNSVFVRQCKNRDGDLDFTRHHFIHTDRGLILKSNR